MSIRAPILLNVSMPIKTERLLIRPVMPGDGAAMYEGIIETKAQYEQWFGWMSTIQSTDGTEERIY